MGIAIPAEPSRADPCFVTGGSITSDHPQNPTDLAAPRTADGQQSNRQRIPRTLISRRRLLTAGLGIGAAMLGVGRISGESQPHQHGSAPLPAVGGTPARIPPKSAPLVDPEVRRSAGGQLPTTLRVRYAYHCTATS